MSGITVLPDAVNARPVPDTPQEPAFDWSRFVEGSTYRIEIYRDQQTALRWWVPQTTDIDIPATAQQLIERMKRQFMGYARRAENYV